MNYYDPATYYAFDARISIGLPILNDDQEYGYPGSIDGQVIAFYPNRHTAELALHNILAAEMPSAFGVLDVEYAPAGWPE